MSALTFEYAVVRVVPRVDRGESMNAGVLVYSQQAQYLGCAVSLDHDRLRALDPDADAEAIEEALRSLTDVCLDDGSQPANAEEIGRRFRWLTAPRSTIVQPGPIHTGLTADPAGEPQRLLRLLVHPIGGSTAAR